MVRPGCLPGRRSVVGPLAGPTLGTENTGVTVFEAPDEAAARRIMDDDPVISGGFARGELRPFRISLLRGRDAG